MTLILPFALLRRPVLVWLAVLIAVLAALMPTLAHARAVGAATQSMAYCTSNGVQEVAGLPDSSLDQESAPAFEHCPLCLLHTDRALLPLHAQLHRFAALRNDSVPKLQQAFFLRGHTAPMPPPRGPPVLH